MKESLKTLLPGYNCGRCTYSTCADFAVALINGDADVSKCPFMHREIFKDNKRGVEKLINEKCLQLEKNEKIIGVIDNYEADIILKPLKAECSCREVLLPMSIIDIQKGDIIEYRPLGCPIVHYAKVLIVDHLLITVHLIGPCMRKQQKMIYKSVGCCMVIAFEGRHLGKEIKVGETVRFLPKHCMMQKVHSGVVVSLESDKVRLEGIDLKV